MFVPSPGIAEMVVRGTLMYLALFAILRFIGRRQAGHFGPAAPSSSCSPCLRRRELTSSWGSLRQCVAGDWETWSPPGTLRGTQGVGVGPGSVVGVGVDTAGEVDGDGAGITVFTDGPAFVMSFTRVVVFLGTSAHSRSMTITAAPMIGSKTLVPGPVLGSRRVSRGSRGFW